jgi:two-component system chemotaxis response regulator CheB
MVQYAMDDRQREQEPGWFVAIGASGGKGLRDIQALLGHLPAGLNAVVLIVLHRPIHQISHLREILARGSKLPVLIAGQGEFLKASTCYIGEPDHHLTVMANSLDGLVDDPGDQYRNRKIDLLFRSVALEAQERAIGVVLSGPWTTALADWRRSTGPADARWFSHLNPGLSLECRRTPLASTVPST